METNIRLPEPLRVKLNTLTAREREVLWCMLCGPCLEKQVASEMGLSEVMVKNHKRALREKMGVKNTTRLIRGVLTPLIPVTARRELIAELDPRRRLRRASRFVPLTRLERETLFWVVKGFLNKQIASIMGLSEQTIKNYRHTIAKKLHGGHGTAFIVGLLKPLASPDKLKVLMDGLAPRKEGKIF